MKRPRGSGPRATLLASGPRAALLASGTALALLLAACAGGSSTTSSVPRIANATFTYDTYTQVVVDGMDPATEYSNAIIAMSNMYETLTRYNQATHQVDPLLATSWTHSANGLTWTFQLRHGVYFHTGRLMTAAAAKAAIERTIKLNGGAAYVWGAVKSIDTPGTYTLVFHLRYPSPLDLEASADYSAYIYDTQAAGTASLTKWLNAPNDAGTGPYQLQTWNKGQEFELILKKFGKYWGGWNGTHFSRLVFRVVTADTTAAQLVESGQVSFVEQINPALWHSLSGKSGVSLVSSPSWVNLLAQINSKALSLPVRQAISYDINYAGIAAALQGAASPASGLVPPGLFGHFGNLPNYSYNPAKAAALLHQAGYGPKGKPLSLTLTYTQGDTNEQVVASLLKSSLAKLNVNLTVQSLAWPTQWGRAKSANATQHQDIFVEQWWPDYADPFSWFTNLLATEKQPYFNLSYYSSPALDSQINRVEALVATNRSAGAQLYRAMQVETLRQAPIAVLYDLNYQYVLASGYSGLTVNPAYPNVVFVYNLHPLAPVD